ncbi:hypothetical protein DBP19_36070 [Streptomyces sp. CS090A]|uniref:hypothetical protein n=1 Tax=Streptomyces sp. CS090A TaxID=2162710 RepID=UPI000D511C28|nr:hypothetical protein [Streptomyces sp. CS090A]PVC80556.1 hypothetical protein DBP19_36070 [Streptomyces sp. CS090A]
MPEAHNQTYIEALGADLAQQNLNALVLAQNGDNQLGRPWAKHPGWRIWNGNLMRIGHHDRDAFVLEANAILPGRMYVDMAHHEHAHLAPLYPPPSYPRDDTDWNQWVHCHAAADGAIPLTIAITQTRDD